MRLAVWLRQGDVEWPVLGSRRSSLLTPFTTTRVRPRHGQNNTGSARIYARVLHSMWSEDKPAPWGERHVLRPDVHRNSSVWRTDLSCWSTGSLRSHSMMTPI